VSITVELTYEMSKALGTRRLEVDRAATVADIVRLTRERFGEQAAEFDRLTRVAAVAVNGVLVTHGRRMRTALADGDRVMFVKASAGG
jgi:molybdopterin converting factor small subunit